jgi:hypothetical protein
MTFCTKAVLYVLILFFGVGISMTAKAQFIPSKYEVGLNVGTLVYQGDLSASYLGYTKALQPAFAIWGSRSLDDYFSVRANILRGNIHADESVYTSPAWRQHRNLKFSSSVTEFSLMLQWDLLGKTYREGMRRFSPYFFAGAGFTILNVKRDWSNVDVNYFGTKSNTILGLGLDTVHVPPAVTPVIPVGAGLRYMLNNHFYINAEASYRLTFTDYIDGFKYAGNPNRNDHYYMVSIGVSYRFGSSKTDCPKVPI